MEDTSQWLVALLIGLPIAALLAWFNKSGSDFKDGFENQALILRMALSKKQRRKINELSIITWMLFPRLRDYKGWITDAGDRARYSNRKY